MENLNNEQMKAVMHKDGPLLIVAGAGTGKTTAITQRMAYIIEQGWARPDEILALTFTRMRPIRLISGKSLSATTSLPCDQHRQWVLRGLLGS